MLSDSFICLLSLRSVCFFFKINYDSKNYDKTRIRRALNGRGWSEGWGLSLATKPISFLCVFFFFWPVMGSPVTDSDEPLTPAGRLFLQPEMNQVIHCVIGLKDPIDMGSIKSQVRDSMLTKHPRFTSLMVRDRHGVEHWRKSSVDLDRHIILVDFPVAGGVDDESAVNEYLADLSTSSGLAADKPLWEIHVLKVRKCVIFRIHHSLGDGISLMSMLLACCRQVGDENALPTIRTASDKTKESKRKEERWWALVLGFVKMVWFSLVFAVEFVLRALWVCDRQTAISGGAGVELWPRKLVTARFWLQDFKVVKKAIPNAVINPNLPFFFGFHSDD